MKMMAMMTPSCEIIAHRISESYDRKLSPRERISIRVHNWGCILCERYRQQLLTIHKLLNQYSTVENVKQDIVLSDEAKVRLKKHLQESPEQD